MLGRIPQVLQDLNSGQTGDVFVKGTPVGTYLLDRESVIYVAGLSIKKAGV